MKINRRTVLRGAGGIALGLPWLEAMASSRFINENIRLGFLFMPNGVNPEDWDPKGRGSNYKTPFSLKPLEPIKSEINVHSNLWHPIAKTGDGHLVKTTTFLSGALVKKTFTDISAAISADQVAAQHIGQSTYLPSIELATKKTGTSNAVAVGYTNIYAGHISWSSAKTPTPKELNPSEAFNRLFKGRKKSASTPEETKSILDYIKEDTSQMKRYLGREDFYRIDEYFSSVRSLEKRIQKASQESFRMPSDAKKPAPGIPRDYDKHVNLMLDIIVLAFQTNRTKVATFMFANGISARNFSFLDGVNGAHHPLTHHKGDPAKKKMLGIITKYHVEQYAKMLMKMRTIKEGDKTLLDNSLILFGSGTKDGNKHNAVNLPILVAGKGGGKVKTGLHQVHKEKEKMNNLLLGMLQTAGCPIKKFGDSERSIL